MLAEAKIPFIFGVLHNFGGNTFMLGSLPSVQSRFENCLIKYKKMGLVKGIGGFPEGINGNDLYFSYLFEINWKSIPKNGDEYLLPSNYLLEYSTRRYGPSLGEKMKKAWKLLGDEIYFKERPEPKSGGGNTGMYREKARSGLSASPFIGLTSEPQNL